MARIVVTGGCGFFGAWILRRLVGDGHAVTVLDRELNTGRWQLALTPTQIAGIAFHRIAIDDPEQVADALRAAAPDAVIHLAGLQVPTCRQDPIAGARVNVIGTLAVFAAARALPTRPALVYASSAAVFGADADYGGGAVGDDTTPRPATHYGAFKLCSEHCARAAWLDDGITSVGLRPLTVYGPGRDVGLTSAPTRAIVAALAGERFTIPFTGATTYTHIDEVADLFVAAALMPQAGAVVYTVGGDVADSATFIRALDRVLPGAARLVSCSGGDLPIASRLDDDGLRRAYPAVARVGLEDGIRRTIAGLGGAQRAAAR